MGHAGVGYMRMGHITIGLKTGDGGLVVIVAGGCGWWVRRGHSWGAVVDWGDRANRHHCR